jgi:dihydrolipoamide dehydrogenase
MATSHFDVTVIGGGPGGYVAAIRASQLGFQTALVEREHLGGICLNWGCIPTKALLRASEIYQLLLHLDEFGFSAKEIHYDFQKVVERSRKVASRLSDGVKFLLKKNRVSVYDGHARLEGRGTVRVEKAGQPPQEVRSNHILLATGARARVLPGIEPDGKLIWSYKEAMVPKEMPRSILVVGAGAIGIEFASFYRSMGAEVTVVEVLPQILPTEDEEIATLARKSFEKRGIKISTAASVRCVKKRGDGLSVEIERGGTPTADVDRLILAVGIVGNTEGLGLEGTKVRVDNGHVVVNEWMATHEPGIYAIGDLVGPPWLAHKASHEGVICVEKIAGVEDVRPLDTSCVPACTYSLPQVASVGLSEKKAREAGYEVRVGRFPYRANGKAIVLGEMEGLIKTVFDAKTGELLGAHMVGAEVTELIQGYAIAKTLETTEHELMHAIFPHPTLSEMMHESVLAAWDRALHM